MFVLVLLFCTPILFLIPPFFSSKGYKTPKLKIHWEHWSPHSPEPYLWTDQNFVNNFWKGSGKEHSCESISKSDQPFQRRRFFREFFMFFIVQEAHIHQSHVYGRIKILWTIFEKGHQSNIPRVFIIKWNNRVVLENKIKPGVKGANLCIFTWLRKAPHESRLFIFIIQKRCQILEIIDFSNNKIKKKKNCQTSIRCLPLEDSFWAFSVVCADLYFNMLKHKKEGQHIQLHILIWFLTVNMWSGTDLYNVYIGKKWLSHMPWTVMLQLNLTHQNFYLVSGFSLGPEF